MFGNSNREIREAVEKTVERIVRGALADADSTLSRMGDLTTLRAEIETLKIEKARKDEEFARRQREVEHKVGLERKRQEFEIAQAKRETSVTVREENLKADRTRFEEQLKFHEDRFAAEVGYLKDMMGQLMERLPSAEIKIARRA